MSQASMQHNHPFLQLDPARLRRLDQLLDLALDLEGAERQAWLQQLEHTRVADADLVPALLRLLDAVDAPGVLDQPLHASSHEDVPAVHTELLPGERIGPWQVDRLAARGGMAAVYLAHRADGAYQQQVALKLLDSTDPRRMAGLRRERELLARLEHPHIARLIDGGISAQGLPWLVMSWVEGENLDAWLARAQPSLEQRLQLFDQIASAVEFAHAHLVLHRDLKPANVRVTPDAQAVLLDFGIARDSAPMADPALLRTQLQFTPAYAAPEQLSGGRVCVGTDVHGLGLLLFELLCDRPAYPQASHSLAAAVQLICHGELPLPSRCTAGKVRAAQLRGDLDAIVSKALQKDVTARYVGVAQLRADLQAYSQHRPVSARHAIWRYRSARWLRRHWLPAGLAALAICGLLGGSWMALREAAKARSERDLAQLEARRQDALREHLMLVFREGAAQGGGVTSKQLLDASAAQLDALYHHDPQLRRSVLLAMGELYFVLGDYTAARAMTERFLVQGDGQTSVADRVTGQLQLAVILLRLGERDPAAILIQSVGEALQPQLRSHHPRELEAQWWAARAALARSDGDPASSLELQRRAVELSQRAVDSTPQKIGVAQSNLGVALLQMGDYAAARIELQKALHSWERGGLAGSSNAVTSLGHLASIEVLLGNLQEARSLYEQALSKASGHVPSAAQAALIHNHARLLLTLGLVEAAQQPLQRALAMAAQFSGAEGPDVASMLLTQAELQVAQQDLPAALVTAGQSVKLLNQRLGEQHPLTTRAQLLEAWVAASSGATDALSRLQQSAHSLLRAPPLLQRQGLRGLVWLTQLQHAAGDRAAALHSIREALDAPILASLSDWEQAEVQLWNLLLQPAPDAATAQQALHWQDVLIRGLGAGHARVRVLQDALSG